MIILHCIQKYGELTGSELYVYELAREQAKTHTVYIQSNIKDGLLLYPTQQAGIKVVDFSEKIEPDVVHTHQITPTIFAKQTYGVPIIQTVHSEVLPDWEYPVEGVIHISIRPSVSEFIHKCGQDCELVFNPFDFDRFNTVYNVKAENNPPKVLFIGSVDYLRIEAIKDLYKQHKLGEIELIGVGNDWNFSGVLSYKPYFNIENLVKKCDYTAGIQIGRSTIEGWLCGKPSIVYDVDRFGNIKDKKILEVPSDLSMFDSKTVAKQIEEIYARHIHSHIR